MNPHRRSQLRSQLSTRARGWRQLIAAHGTPLLVLDPYRVAAQYSLLTESLRGFHLHYAVKALPHPAVLTVLAASGSGFDVATTAEVDLVARLGVPMDRCIFTHPVKKPADIDYAYAHGIRTFVVDNPVEAAKFVGRAPDIGILVRLGFPNPSAKSDLSTKFGTAPAEAELLVKHVIAAGVRFAGFSFHVGSQGSSVAPYRDALRATLDLTRHVERTLGLHVSSIDIGGGFPVSYRDEMPAIGAIGAVIDEVLGSNRDYTMLAEPGRFVVADCMTLFTSVVGSAIRAGRTRHYLDDGLYGSYSNVMTEDVHPPILALSELEDDGGRAPLEPVTLAGPTCDSVDVVAADYPMPTLAVGDVVVSPSMGAYTAVTSSRFNGVPATPIVVSPRALYS
ncbi:ornithine decarboxylase [Mycobacterium antarcticum]|uniref:type III PLP-dependent enzyme n=1 Tax=Mycolicibacterium sp. TUM20983 TaxID=3023369 RepID=UPI00239AFF5C|nr:type III PLP-dependent enzyme [Mycolicibacterium sp. TUM20983]GLP73903.1 ornithine decarboxylase [Mycolicibacterium sp. TUM20983]